MINIKKLLVATILLISHQFLSVQAAEENKKYDNYKWSFKSICYDWMASWVVSC